MLDFLSVRNLRITFFVVGQDAALEKNHAALKAISANGHEIGNHSFSHEPWLHLYTEQQVQEEIESTDFHISSLTGQHPIGFRGPGFSFTETVLAVLKQRGYLYDASTFPTYLGPLARLYYFLNANLSKEKRKSRDALFGSIWEGLRPLKPYRWGGNDGLVEIPVTTMPLLRIPIHLSYILYLSAFSSGLALSYFRSALAFCRLAGVSPSILLHPLDFLGADDGVGLDFFPAMRLSYQHKLKIVGDVLGLLCDHYQVVRMREHAQCVAEGSATSVIDFRTRALVKNL